MHALCKSPYPTCPSVLSSPILCSCAYIVPIFHHPPPTPSQGKEVATQIKVLPSDSVQFDSVAEELFQGAVRTPVIRSFTHGRGKELEPQPGELVYQSEGDGYVYEKLTFYKV